MSLQALQQAFQDRILFARSGIESALRGNEDRDFDARLDAYVGGYRTRLVEALATTYPVLKSTLGETEFARRMQCYIDAWPSRHFSVRQYGARVSDAIMTCPPTLENIGLADLARWEWTLAEVFDAPDDAPLTEQALAAIRPAAWPTLVFRLRTSVRRFDTQTNAVAWWRAANGLSDRPAGLSETEPTSWLLWRRGVTTLFRSLEPLESSALDLAQAGVTFGSICELVAASVPESEVALRAASLLRSWIAEELLADAYPVNDLDPNP